MGTEQSQSIICGAPESCPLVSIIIPHYNIPDLLDRCLASIPRRDDVEVIVVDDNSPDAESVAGIAAKYSNVRLVVQPSNGGGGAARNVGMRHARGRWLLFADADDFFTYGLSKMIDRYADSPADVVFFNCLSVDTDLYVAASRGSHLNGYIEEYSVNPAEAELNLRYLFGEPWCKMVKRQMVESLSLKFDEIPVHNDTLFSYSVGHNARSVSVEPTAVYCVTDRVSSVSKEVSMRRQIIRCNVFGRKNAFMRDHGVNRFDNLMLRPFYDAKAAGDKASFNDYLQIVRGFGYSEKDILKRMRAQKLERILGSLMRVSIEKLLHKFKKIIA